MRSMRGSMREGRGRATPRATSRLEATWHVGIVLTVIALAGSGRACHAQERTDELDFFIGEWEATSHAADGTVVGRSRGGAKWILDGTVMQHDYLELNPDGEVVFRGTSLRTRVPDTGRWVVHWVMASTPGYTYIDSVWEDGELRGTGYGFDGGGTFEERYRYWEITDSSYTFQLSRSYDDGGTWRTYPLTRARKVAGGH